MVDSEAPKEILVFEQDFSKFEESLKDEVWEVDGDEENLKLYATEAKDAEPGALVLMTSGGLASVSELMHPFDAPGVQVSRLTIALLCESIDLESNGTFTVGLAFDDDLEEAVLLACTIRRPRPEPKLPREPGDPPEEPEVPKPIALHVNGQVIEDLGDLPQRLELDIQLSWKERTTVVKHKLHPSFRDEEVEVASQTMGFYTTDVPFEVAKAVFLRATGSVTVRLVSLKCSCAT
eukprot:symbB.v1.2.035119.t1/scaffold4663.1/size36762/2